MVSASHATRLPPARLPPARLHLARLRMAPTRTILPSSLKTRRSFTRSMGYHIPLPAHSSPIAGTRWVRRSLYIVSARSFNVFRGGHRGHPSTSILPWHALALSLTCSSRGCHSSLRCVTYCSHHLFLFPDGFHSASICTALTATSQLSDSCSLPRCAGTSISPSCETMHDTACSLLCEV